VKAAFDCLARDSTIPFVEVAYVKEAIAYLHIFASELDRTNGGPPFAAALLERTTRDEVDVDRSVLDHPLLFDEAVALMSVPRADCVTTAEPPL
jgi:hypothetical protein